MLVGEIIKPSELDMRLVSPPSSGYARWFIFVGILEKFNKGLLITTTTQVDKHQHFEPECILFNQGDFGFAERCCVNSKQIFVSDIDKIKLWEKKGQIKDNNILINIHKKIQNPAHQNIIPAHRTAIKLTYQKQGIIF
ncbi:MAG: hypothetical protein QM529_02735 [Hydrotalea sp.]|nr:hypothetical protein [Hydrotalea sp.]